MIIRIPLLLLMFITTLGKGCTRYANLSYQNILVSFNISFENKNEPNIIRVTWYLNHMFFFT